MTGRLLIAMAMLAAGQGQDAAQVADRPPDRAAYEAARREAGRGAEGQIRLALWCEAHGMTAERARHLAAAVLQDPSNALARGLMGLVAHGSKWLRPEEVARQAGDDPGREAVMQEYLERRARAAEKADDQWRLALWCEEKGLKEQAIAHYHAVVRRDPGREAAWRHLGFKKAGGRWVKPEWQEAARREAEAQARANKHWKPLLERWRSGLSGRDKSRRSAAEAGLAQVADPRAVPMVWAVLVPRGAEEREVAVRVLGQIDSPGSSRALALLALSGKSADVRGEAMKILRRRDPRDFAPTLVGLIRDPIDYEVKPVEGPGRPGQLVIKDRTARRKRIYASLPEPDVALQEDDRVSIDPATGLPVILRTMGVYPSPLAGLLPAPRMTTSVTIGPPAGGAQVAGLLNKAGLPAAQSHAVGQVVAANAASSSQFTAFALNAYFGTMSPDSNGYRLLPAEILQIPVGQMQKEARISARVAQQQLAGDVQAIEAYNAPIREANRSVRKVLSETAGIDLGDDRMAWEKWLVDLSGYALLAQKASSDETTIVEQVPLSYQPQAAPVLQQGLAPVLSHSCFGAGTLVRSQEGLCPIESFRPGDLVLTQDPRNGGLKYRAVVEVYHNPPNETYRVVMETGESVVATGIHRLWLAGQGWAMTRDLKPGDVLRTLGGVAAVKTVETDRPQPVYNLRVADGESYFVGRSGVLAHDNSTINPVPEPFDAVAQPAEAASSGKATGPASMLRR
jgi:hypothetical protein